GPAFQRSWGGTSRGVQPGSPGHAKAWSLCPGELGIMSTADVTYAVEPGLEAMEFLDLLQRSTLAERRPVDEPDTIRGMLAHAGVLVTARVDGRLVGVSRAITDFSYCTYLSDLAVDRAFQRRGIGRALIQRTHEAAGLKTTLILLAAPLARSYYPHI